MVMMVVVLLVVLFGEGGRAQGQSQDGGHQQNGGFLHRSLSLWKRRNVLDGHFLCTPSFVPQFGLLEIEKFPLVERER
jgi:hypothetical protein